MFFVHIFILRMNLGLFSLNLFLWKRNQNIINRERCIFQKSFIYWFQAAVALDSQPAPVKKQSIVPFDWKDPLNLESQLTEEEIMIRDVAHDYWFESSAYDEFHINSDINFCNFISLKNQ